MNISSRMVSTALLGLSTTLGQTAAYGSVTATEITISAPHTDLALTGVNVGGVVCGYYIRNDGKSQAFTLTPGGKFLSLETPYSSRASSINTDGTVVGSTLLSQRMSSVIWDGQGRISIICISPGGCTSINGKGAVTFYISGTAYRSGTAYVYTNDIVYTLDRGAFSSTYANEVNSSGMMVGSVSNGTNTYAAYWKNQFGSCTLLNPSNTNSAAVGMNDSGLIVGYDTNPTTNTQVAVEWTSKGNSITIGPAGGSANSVATAISSTGIVVGEVNNMPFYWTPASGMMLLPLPAGIVDGTPVAINGSAAVGAGHDLAGHLQAIEWNGLQ